MDLAGSYSGPMWMLAAGLKASGNQDIAATS